MKKNTVGHLFDLPLFFHISKQFLAPGGLNAECVNNLVSYKVKPEASRKLALRPRPKAWEAHNFLN